MTDQPAPARSGGTAVRPAPARSGGVRHLYVHLPFCRSICAYCDFSPELAGPHLRHGRMAAYLKALLEELAVRRGCLASPIETAYVGGGTPTAVPREMLAPLLREVGGCLAGGGEFTVEADPADVGPDLLESLAACGVTRLSVGVQSFSPAARRALGRRSPQDAMLAGLATLRDQGWPDWNLDLVFGIPGTGSPDAIADVAAADVAAAVAAGPTHVSLYDLTYTPAYARWVCRRLGADARPAAEDAAEAGYEAVRAGLTAAGYRRYEVSNYALPGRESCHNLAYWRGEDYLGLGAGAVSTVGPRRATGPPTVSAYLAGRPGTIEYLTPQTRLFERAMLGLRTAEGVTLSEVAPVLDMVEVDRLVARGLLEKACATLRATPRGLDLSTAVLTAVLRPVTGDQPPDVH